MNTSETETDDGSQMFGPMSGTWALEREAVNDTCGGAVPGGPDPAATFVLDYDGGDQFQIELGENDAVCEMDGTTFTCTHSYEFILPLPDIDAAINYEVIWNGEFSSPTSIVDGLELVTITCSGGDCSMIENVPCSRERMFTAEFMS